MFERLLTSLYVTGERIAQKAHVPGFRRPSYEEVASRIYELKGQLFEKTNDLRNYGQQGSVLTGLDLHLPETMVIQKSLMKDLARIKGYREYKDLDEKAKTAISTPAEEDGLWASFGHIRKTEKIANVYFSNAQNGPHESYLINLAKIHAEDMKALDDYTASLEKEAGVATVENVQSGQSQQLLVATRPEIFTLRQYLRTSPAAKMYGKEQILAAGSLVIGERGQTDSAYQTPKDSAKLTEKLYDRMTFATLSEKTLADRAMKGATGKGLHMYFGVRRDKSMKDLMKDLSIVRENVTDGKTKAMIDGIAVRQADYMVSQIKRIDKALKDMGSLTGFSTKVVGTGTDATPEYKSSIGSILESPDVFAKFYEAAVKREGKKSRSAIFDDLMGHNAVNQALKRSLGKGLVPDKRLSEGVQDLSVILKNDQSGYVKDAILKVFEGFAHEYEIIDKSLKSVYKGKDWMGSGDKSLRSLIGNAGNMGKFADELYKARKSTPFNDPAPAAGDAPLYALAKKVDGKIASTGSYVERKVTGKKKKPAAIASVTQQAPSRPWGPMPKGWKPIVTQVE